MSDSSSGGFGKIAWPASVSLIAVSLGALVVVVGLSALVAIPGALAGLAILSRPLLGLAALMVPIPFEDALLIGQLGTITKLMAAGVAAIWLVRKAITGDSWRNAVSTPLAILGVLFITLALTSFLWAEYTSGFSIEIVRLLMLLALAILVIDIADSWIDLRWLVRALIIGGNVGAILVISQYFGVGARRAGEEVAGGVNATALVLVTLLPLGFFLVRTGSTLVWRLLGISYVSLALLAVTVTFSRMGFLLVPLILAFEAWETLSKGRARAAVTIVVTVAGIIALLRVAPLQEVQDRIATIGPYIEQTFSTGGADGDPYMSGRGYHLYVAYRIFQDHPLVGVGYGNYGDHFLREYQFRVPGAERFYRTARNPHSSFAGILAELGLLGIFIWLTLLGMVTRSLVLAWKRTSVNRNSECFHMVRAIAISFVLLLAYGFYAEMQYEKVFWLVLGLSVVVERLSRGLRGRRRTPQESEIHEDTGRLRLKSFSSSAVQ